MLIGYDCKEASEQSKSLFAEPEKFIDDVETILQNKVKVQKELLKLKDGRVFSRDYLPIFYQNNYLGHLWSYADITEEIKDKEYLISVIEKEKNLNQLKSKFMRITSHEIRTPLTAVFANIELLELIIKKGGISQNILHEYFSKMKKEINRMDSILSELILVGKMEEGKSFFKFQHRNIISYLINIVNEFYTPYSDGRSATVINNSKINEIVFCEKMLKHAIINILNNAFKYSAGKTSPIMVIDADEQFITITVQDFGIGIPDNEIDMVFESFYRAQNVSNISGSGIGLMFSDFIVKQHQGTIKIESRLNEGSIVKITLPINLELNKTIQ
jgi:signal transduction histidine kinase